MARTAWWIQRGEPNPGRDFPKGCTPWNKGLTKEADDRVRAYGETRMAHLPDWECACGCGQKIDWHTRRGKRRYEALERGYAYIRGHMLTMPYVRKKMVAALPRGENHCCWKGGISGWRTRFMNTPEYKQWRKAVLERDNYTCQHCHKRGGDLEAHHPMAVAEYPEKMFDIDNGITLCVTCHRREEAELRSRNERGQFAPGICEV